MILHSLIYIVYQIVGVLEGNLFSVLKVYYDNVVRGDAFM